MAACCFDPCTCQTTHTPGKWERVCEQCPDEIRCKKVWKENTVCEQVPCTTYVKECQVEKVPYTVCKKIAHNCVKQVPYTVTRNVRSTVVEKVPYTVTRNVSAVVHESVPYTTTRVVHGRLCRCQLPGHLGCWAASKAAVAVVRTAATAAGSNGYVASNGPLGYETEGPGRQFVEGAHYEKTWTTTSTRMVQEVQTRKINYTVMRTVTEDHVQQVPYTVTRMVPHTVKKMVPFTVDETIVEKHVKKVPYTVCRNEQYTVCKQVPFQVCKQVPYTVCTKVPFTVTECVPTVVCKKVKTCVSEDVPVTKCHKVAVCVEACSSPCDSCDHEGFAEAVLRSPLRLQH